MKPRVYVFLFLISLAIVGTVTFFQKNPGYMDADYYYAGGLRLATGSGLSEPFLWNYLDNPVGLPHPSNAYWMPLASLLAAVGMKFTNFINFNGARLPFLLISAGIPPLTAALSYSFSQRKESAVLAGLLAAVPAFYLSYMSTTDTFGVYMFLGVSWFLIAGKKIPFRILGLEGEAAPFLMGILAGFLHLARADGIIWLFLSFVAVIYQKRSGQNIEIKHRLRSYFVGFFLCLSGYLLVMGPWMLRNLAVFGTPLSPGGWRVLWLTNYDELYSYPASLLTPARWWASGWIEILRSQLWSLSQNLQSAFAVQGEIFLAPLILLGLWRCRNDSRISLGMLAWLLTLIMMTFVFPHAGWRGGFFHSGAAVQPLFWAVAPFGLDVFVDWGVRVRRWHPLQAKTVFRAGLLGLAVMLAFLVVQKRVIGNDIANPAWNQGGKAYAALETELESLGAGPDDVVLVNNPPGYYVASGRPAIAIPNGGEATLLEVSKRYDASYLLIEKNHVVGLAGFYDTPGDKPGWHYLADSDGTFIYKVIDDYQP